MPLSHRCQHGYPVCALQEDEDEEQDEEEEEEREDQLATRARVLRMLIGGSHSAARRRIPEGTVRLPLPIQPLQGNLAARTNADTRAQDVGQANDIWVGLLLASSNRPPYFISIVGRAT